MESARDHQVQDEPQIAVEPEGRVTRWNDGAERLFGWTRAEAVGRNAASLIAAGLSIKT